MITNFSLAALSVGVLSGLAIGPHWDAGMGLCSTLALVAFARALWAEARLAEENRDLWAALEPTIRRQRASVNWGACRDCVPQAPTPADVEVTPTVRQLRKTNA